MLWTIFNGRIELHGAKVQQKATFEVILDSFQIFTLPDAIEMMQEIYVPVVSKYTPVAQL